MARNVRIDTYRKKAESYPGSENLAFEKADSFNAHNALEVAEQKVQLHRALNLLSSENREIIWLARFEDMRYRQIAEIIGCSEGALKVKMHRAMKELKNNFFKMEDQ